jgi:hypothetical protein
MRWLVVAALVALASPAHADDDTDEPTHMRFIERADQLTVSAKISALFDRAAYEALNSGFPSTILINTFVYEKGDPKPIDDRTVIWTVVYDLWDENYVIRLGEHAKPIKVKYQSEALKILTTVEDLPVTTLDKVPYDDVFYLRMTVLLNPVDQKTLTEVRRWLSQGTGGGLDRGGVFFGNIVSVFVNPKIADADRVLKLRSQPFFRPKP